MIRACTMHKVRKRHTKFMTENLKQRNNLEDLSRDMKTTLKWILN